MKITLSQDPPSEIIKLNSTGVIREESTEEEIRVAEYKAPVQVLDGLSTRRLADGSTDVMLYHRGRLVGGFRLAQHESFAVGMELMGTTAAEAIGESNVVRLVKVGRDFRVARKAQPDLGFFPMLETADVPF